MNIEQYDKPHNLEAERALLSYMINDPSVIDASIPIQAFYEEDHKDLYATMMMLKATGSVIDAVTIGKDNHKLGQLTIEMMGMFTTKGYDDYLTIVLDLYRRRETIDLCDKITKACRGGKKIETIISRSITRLNTLIESGSIESSGVQYYNPSDLISRGNDCVDDVFGYMCNDLCVIVAGPGMGKTERTCHIADTNGRNGKRVLYYSLELSPHKLKLRSAYARIGLSKAQFQRGEYTEQQKEIIKQNYDAFDKFFELTGDTKKKSLEIVLTDIEQRAKEGYELIIVDNLGKITRDGRSDLDVEKEFSSRCQDLKNKYRHLNIIIIHHEAKAKEKQVMGMASVRGNQKIGDNATIMIQISRDKDPDATSYDQQKVNLYQFKDTEGGVIANAEVYFRNGSYNDEYK